MKNHLTGINIDTNRHDSVLPLGSEAFYTDTKSCVLPLGSETLYTDTK